MEMFIVLKLFIQFVLREISEIIGGIVIIKIY
jgi:hypothetical protein